MEEVGVPDRMNNDIRSSREVAQSKKELSPLVDWESQASS